VFLGPTDDPYAFKWHEEGGYAVLDRKDNGECIYLNDTGCSIHGSAPAICKAMDCRILYQQTSPEVRERRGKENPQMIHIYRAAERLGA
jgi:Fe-S-cluster containining protein